MQNEPTVRSVFILGCKGVPARYGGFETFVDNLVTRRTSDGIRYYVACMSDRDAVEPYGAATCFHIRVPQVGSAKAVLYDLLAFRRFLRYIRKNRLEGCIIYVLACRLGPFFPALKRAAAKLGAKVYVNPDGHEWKRSKWSRPIKAYWKYSEGKMVRDADLLICDSVNIERYLREEYSGYSPATTFIAYGAAVPCPAQDEEPYHRWLEKNGLREKEYDLIVGRFVPENNYQTMIEGFMASGTKKALVLVTDVKRNAFFEVLERQTGMSRDGRVRFVGTVYDAPLLAQIRRGAFAYLHGHEVGGTNPSLLEALAATELNLLLDVPFNREVGGDGALYFPKDAQRLARLLDEADRLPAAERERLRQNAVRRIREQYSWEKIVGEYERLFQRA